MEMILNETFIKIVALLGVIAIFMFRGLLGGGFLVLLIGLIVSFYFFYFLTENSINEIEKNKGLPVICYKNGKSVFIDKYKVDKEEKVIIDENNKEYDLKFCSLVPKNILEKKPIICKEYIDFFIFTIDVKEHYLSDYIFDKEKLKIIDPKTGKVFAIGLCK